MRLLVGYTNQMPEVAGKRPLPGRENAGDDILAFGAGYAHINVTPDMEWQNILAQCPPHWTPDVYIHWSPEYNPIPAGLENAPCLTVGVFGDWNLGGQAMRAVGGLFDALIADEVGCERLRNMGFANVLHGLLWAQEPDKHRIVSPSPNDEGAATHRLKLNSPSPGDEGAANAKPQMRRGGQANNSPSPSDAGAARREVGVRYSERDIDILMIGNFNHAIQWERAKWLARVARLSSRYKVVLTSGVYGDEYVKLMNRAKIVFNRSIRGEANMRAYEAPACGALMFYEAENREIHNVYRNREHCLLYDNNALEDLLAYYLAPENTVESEQIAEQGRAQVARHSYAHHFADILNQLEPLVAAHQAGSLPRRPFCRLPTSQQTLQLATHWLLTCNVGVFQKIQDTRYEIQEEKTAEGKREEGREKREEPQSTIHNRQSAIENLLAVLAGEMARCAAAPNYARQRVQRAIGLARQVIQQEPDYALARLNLAYLYLAAGHASEGEKILREVAENLATLLEAWQMQGVSFPRSFQWFDVALERVYGEHAPGSDAWREQIQALLTCRVQLTLAEITLARGQFAESARHAALVANTMPILGEAHYAHACALRALGRVEDAIAAYQETLACAPFHVEAREGLARLCLDTERAGQALSGLDEWLLILNGCPVYANLIPATQTLRRQAQAMARQQAHTSASENSIEKFLALPDWNRPADWQALVRAFARTYAPEDPVLLMLRADPATHPDAHALLGYLAQFLQQDLGIAADRLPNITLLNQPLPPDACWKLLRAADALIADSLPVFWRELAQARCLPVLAIEEMNRQNCRE